MKYNIIVQHEAIIEIQVAYEWYEEKRVGLGDELLLEIEICLQKISEHPENYGYVNTIFRRIRTHRFPYFLVFEIEEGNVIINSVRHAKRK